MIYTQAIGGEVYEAVFEVMRGRKLLALKTFYIRV
jgi:hypothetical protein